MECTAICVDFHNRAIAPEEDAATEVENKLYCGKFKEAIEGALDLLKNKNTGCRSDSCRTRCMYVLLQAHFMTRDFTSLDKFVQEFDDIKSFSPQVVVLWVLILLDFQQYDRAKREIVEYLHIHTSQTCTVMGQQTASPIDMLALARMYAVELVAKTEHQYERARLWLQNDAHFLSAANRAQLLKEVEAVQEHDRQVQSGCGCNPEEESMLCTLTGYLDDSEVNAEVLPLQSTDNRKSVDAEHADGRWPWLSTWSLPEGSWGLDCLSNTKQKLEQVNPYHAAAAAALGGMLVYAFYAERGPISRYLRKHAAQLRKGATELCGLALAVSPSPALTTAMRAARS